MPWIAPSSDDVLTECAPQEASAIAGIQGDDNLDAILARVVAEIRGAISSGDYDLDPDETKIPPSLFSDCIAIARWRLLNAIPALADFITKTREKAYEDALAKLKAISSQKLAVESPTDDPTAASRSGTWNSENKLLMRTHPVPPPSTQAAGSTNPPYANPDAPPDN